MHRTLLVLVLLAVAGVACQGSKTPYAPQGDVLPTVAGRAPMTFDCLEAARTAFTRACGSLTAVLHDAAWLRHMGDPATVEEQYRAYFDCGYTTFSVELKSECFTKPTQEVFLLEDSCGGRYEGRPLKYEGSPVLVDNCYFSTFDLSFQHVLSAQLAWIRLTRVADGASVTWNFRACPPPPPAPPRAVGR